MEWSKILRFYLFIWFWKCDVYVCWLIFDILLYLNIEDEEGCILCLVGVILFNDFIKEL